MMSQQRMPSTEPSACGKRVFRNPGNASSLASRTWRSRSAKMSSTKILQPSCSPKKLTLLPTTGPRSSSTGDSRDVSVVRNLRSALVAKTGSSTTDGLGGTSGSFLRGVRRSRRPTKRFGVRGFGFEVRVQVLVTTYSDSASVTSPNRNPQRRTANPERLLRSDALRRLRLLRLLRLLLRLSALRLRRLGGLRLPLTLHVDTAAEVRAFGNRDARRDDVAIHRPVVADVDLVAGGDVAGDFAQHDDRLGEHLGLDAAVGTNRQHVLAQLNRAFDVAFNRQIFAAVQLALDDD